MAQNDLNELQEKIQFYETILDNIHNGVMITDPEWGRSSSEEKRFEIVFIKSLPTSLCPPGQRPLWVGDQREEKSFPCLRLPAGRQGRQVCNQRAPIIFSELSNFFLDKEF